MTVLLLTTLTLVIFKDSTSRRTNNSLTSYQKTQQNSSHLPMEKTGLHRENLDHRELYSESVLSTLSYVF